MKVVAKKALTAFGNIIDIVATGREMVKENKISSMSGKILVISLGLRENLNL